MAFNGSGTFQRVRNWVADAAANIKIRADYHDSEDDGFAAGLSNCITKDGQTTITQNIPFNSKRITGLADPVNPQDAATQAFANLKLAKSGDTMTGDLQISKASPTIILNKPASGTSANVQGKMNASTRWVEELGDATAEASGDVGSDYVLSRYSNAGALLGAAIKVRRSDGVVTLTGNAYITKADPTLLICKTAAAQSNVIYGTLNATIRWALVLGSGAAESGSNAGSDFAVNRYDDAGAYVETPFTIKRNNGNALFTKSVQVRAGGELADIYSQSVTTNWVQAQYGLACNLAYNAAASGAYALTTGYGGTFAFDVATGNAYFQTTGASAAAGAPHGAVSTRLTFGGKGGIVIATPADATTPLTVALPASTTTYGIIANGHGAAAAMLGYSGAATTYYGMVGAFLSSTWSFYGNYSAFLTSGTWQTSDETVKDNIAPRDVNASLANVNAVPVITFDLNEPQAPDGSSMPSEPDRVGWSAQEIEPYIPAAVRDVAIPAHDLLMKARAKKLAHVPAKDSPEGKALLAEDMSLKAINLQPLVAELWGAVQALSAKVAALEAARP